jgi:hypothetical protein
LIGICQINLHQIAMRRGARCSHIKQLEIELVSQAVNQTGAQIPTSACNTNFHDFLHCGSIVWAISLANIPKRKRVVGTDRRPIADAPRINCG